MYVVVDYSLHLYEYLYIYTMYLYCVLLLQTGEYACMYILEYICARSSVYIALGSVHKYDVHSTMYLYVPYKVLPVCNI